MERAKIRKEAANIRDRFIKENPYCKRYGGGLAEMHHIVPVVDGGTNDEENLAALCSQCHREVDVWNEAWRIPTKQYDYIRTFDVFLNSPPTHIIAAIMICEEITGVETPDDGSLFSIAFRHCNHRAILKKETR